MFSAPPIAQAEDAWIAHVGKKLCRGVVNLITGWAEIPKQVYIHTRTGLPVLGTFQGVMEGVGMTFARTSAGMFETGTFLVPLPWYYAPLLEPEFVWMDPGEGGRTDSVRSEKPDPDAL